MKLIIILWLLSLCFGLLFGAIPIELTKIIKKNKNLSICTGPAGAFKHEHRNDIYYTCWKGRIYMKKCPNGRVFDEFFKKCRRQRKNKQRSQINQV